MGMEWLGEESGLVNQISQLLDPNYQRALVLGQAQKALQAPQDAAMGGMASRYGQMEPPTTAPNPTQSAPEARQNAPGSTPPPPPAVGGVPHYLAKPEASGGVFPGQDLPGGIPDPRNMVEPLRAALEKGEQEDRHRRMASMTGSGEIQEFAPNQFYKGPELRGGGAYSQMTANPGTPIHDRLQREARAMQLQEAEGKAQLAEANARAANPMAGQRGSAYQDQYKRAMMQAAWEGYNSKVQEIQSSGQPPEVVRDLIEDAKWELSMKMSFIEPRGASAFGQNMKQDGIF